MPTLKQILRQMMVVICGLAIPSSMPGLPLGVVATLMRGGHELATVEHEGHRDLILKHRNADQAENGAHHDTHLAGQPGHHHEDHTLRLASNDFAWLPSTAALPVPMVTAMTDCFARLLIPDRSSRPATKFHLRPPPTLGGVMLSLRTTVLVV